MHSAEDIRDLTGQLSAWLRRITARHHPSLSRALFPLIVLTTKQAAIPA